MTATDATVAALSLGLARQPLPPGQDALAALALAGQAARFRASPRLEAVQDQPLPDDPLPTLPQRARTPLLRLADRMDQATAATLRPLLATHLAAAGYRLHPFDYPALAAFLPPPGSPPSPVERAWLQRDATPGAAPAALTADPWPDATIREQVALFVALRRADPAASRSLLEAILPAQPARVRGELVAALDARLGPDDQTLLAACAEDRAAEVRRAAKGAA